MSSFGRLDVILLAVMLTYVFAVVIYVYCRYYLARPGRGIASTRTRTSVAVLNIELGGLKSIALTAPYLGLAGTCEGMLSALGGGAMEKHAFMAMITTRMALALVPTAAAIPVAVMATCSYNFLRARVDLLGGGVFDERKQSSRHFQGVRRFPTMKRFSELPVFGLIAASALAFAIAGFMTFASFHTPKGFYLELASAGCEYDDVDRLIVLHITDAGKLFLNLVQEDRNNLAGRLSAIYGMRQNRTLYLVADAGVPFQTVADALDTVENISSTVGPQADGMKKDNLDIKVRLVTPKVFDAGCVVTTSGPRVLR